MNNLIGRLCAAVSSLKKVFSDSAREAAAAARRAKKKPEGSPKGDKDEASQKPSSEVMSKIEEQLKAGGLEAADVRELKAEIKLDPTKGYDGSYEFSYTDRRGTLREEKGFLRSYSEGKGQWSTHRGAGRAAFGLGTTPEKAIANGITESVKTRNQYPHLR